MSLMKSDSDSVKSVLQTALYPVLSEKIGDYYDITKNIQAYGKFKIVICL